MYNSEFSNQKSFQFGKWLVIDEGIHLMQDGYSTYFIEKHRLVEIDYGYGENVYCWLCHMSHKSDMTRDDIYALCTAIVFAIDLFNIKVPENFSFVETFNKIIFQDELNPMQSLFNME